MQLSFFNDLTKVKINVVHIFKSNIKYGNDQKIKYKKINTLIAIKLL